jgi:hypothetical protein
MCLRGMTKNRDTSNFIASSEFARFFGSEVLLQQSVAALLTRIPGVRGVQITHGVLEVFGLRRRPCYGSEVLGQTRGLPNTSKVHRLPV